jgi:Ca2+-dependent lipid-binding protein
VTLGFFRAPSGRLMWQSVQTKKMDGTLFITGLFARCAANDSLVIEAKDLFGLNHDNSSDPFVNATYGALKYVTKTLRKTVNPAWNETFGFNMTLEKLEMLEFQVKDWEKLGRSRLIGRVMLDLEQIFDDTRVYQGWYDLENEKLAKQVGQLHLKLELRVETVSRRCAPARACARSALACVRARARCACVRV